MHARKVLGGDDWMKNIKIQSILLSMTSVWVCEVIIYSPHTMHALFFANNSDEKNPDWGRIFSPRMRTLCCVKKKKKINHFILRLRLICLNFCTANKLLIHHGGCAKRTSRLPQQSINNAGWQAHYLHLKQETRIIKTTILKTRYDNVSINQSTFIDITICSMT